MTYRYFVKPVIYLGTLWCWSLAFCGPIWLASEPIVHDMMQHGFFAKALIQKRASLLRAIGNYPAIIVGGSVESTLADRLSLDINPVIDMISVNTVLCLDHNAMLALPFIYDTAYQKGVTFSLKQFALILGGQSKYNTETDLGFLKLPCKLYGAIGRFSSSALPISSEAFYARDIMPYTIEVASHNMQTSPSLLLGIQREDGPNSLHVVLTAFNLSKRIVKPKLIAALQYTLSNSRYQIKAGTTYNNVYRHGTIQVSVLKRDRNVKLIIQQLFGSWLGTDDLRTKKSPGHLELNWDVTPSTLRLPITLAVGYGWSNRFAARKANTNTLFATKKANTNALFARVSVMLTPYAKLKVGMKVRTRDWDLRGFITGLSIAF